MGRFQKNIIFKKLFLFLPIFFLYISVLSEFDANYLNIDYLSFNFAYILIFYWSLKKIEHFGYLSIFFAGVINDVVSGLPIGLSSFSYMLICVAARYLRSITLRPNIINDWIFFLIIVSLVNSIYYSIISFIFKSEIDYIFLIVNNFFTFLLYFFCRYIFDLYYKYLIGRFNV